MEWFRSRGEAKVVIEAWRQHYNEVRPHSSLGYLTPSEFAASIKEQVSRSKTQRPDRQRAGSLRYVEPPRSAPLRNRLARGTK